MVTKPISCLKEEYKKAAKAGYETLRKPLTKFTEEEWSSLKKQKARQIMEQTNKTPLQKAFLDVVEWLYGTGKTNKPRTGRIPKKLLQNLEKALYPSKPQPCPSCGAIHKAGKNTLCDQ